MSAEVAIAPEEFEAHRGYLFGIAYRMTGSVADAEDIVQDAWLRMERAGESAPVSLRSYLATVVTRLALDHLKSARVQREQYTGTWLPEPLFAGERPASVDPAALNEGRETLSLALLFLLERLSPIERAVFVLHEAFDYRHREIADVLDISEAASRQHLRRGRSRLGDRYPVTAASREQHERTGRELVEAVMRGDIAGVVSMLAGDAAVYSDGGGVVAAAMNEVHGALRCARLLAGIAKKTPPEGAEFVDVNGEPGVAVYLRGRLDSLMTFELDPTGHIRGVYIVRNPHKLGRRREH